MKKINKKNIISIALVCITLLIIMSTNVIAVNPDEYEPSQTITSNNFLGKAGIVLGWIKYVGILISVIVLTVIGIKYIFSSVEGKAEYKKAMLPYILGCFLLVGISIVIGLIENIAYVEQLSYGPGTGGVPIIQERPSDDITQTEWY